MPHASTNQTGDRHTHTLHTHTYTHTHTCTHTHLQGAESLLLNGLNHTLCISLTEVVSTLSLQPDSYGKQVSGSPWREVWLTVLRVIAGMLRSLGHQFLTHCLDFVGVHQERLAAVSITHTHIHTHTHTHTHTHHTHTHTLSIGSGCVSCYQGPALPRGNRVCL